MTIHFPRSKIRHHRRKNQEAVPVFRTRSGKILSWGEAQEIYYAVQDVYDREDVRNDVDWRVENDGLTQEQYRDIREHLADIVAAYRSRLDEDVGNVWSNTLGNVLYDFMNRHEHPYLWN